MKGRIEIKKALERVANSEFQHSGLTYEAGIEEALSWVLGEVPDEEFEYAKKKGGNKDADRND